MVLNCDNSERGGERETAIAVASVCATSRIEGTTYAPGRQTPGRSSLLIMRLASSGGATTHRAGHLLKGLIDLAHVGRLYVEAGVRLATPGHINGHARLVERLEGSREGHGKVSVGACHAAESVCPAALTRP